MPHVDSIRIRNAWCLLTEQQKRTIRNTRRAASETDERVDPMPAELEDPVEIRRFLEARPSLQSATLLLAMMMFPEPSTLLDEQDVEQAQRLLDAGLAFPVDPNGSLEVGGAIQVPLEVRSALADSYVEIVPSLAVSLSQRDRAEIEQLAELHHLTTKEDSDLFDLCDELSAALMQPERLETLVADLEPETRKVLLWILHHGSPGNIAASRPSDEPAIGGVTSDRYDSAVRVLYRLGLLTPQAQVGDEQYFAIPHDLANALRRLVTEHFLEDLRGVYLSAEELWIPASADAAPIVVGGDAPLMMRMRLLRCLQGEYDPSNPYDALLAMLGAFEPESGAAGEFASRLLDVQGSQALARTALTIWLEALNDPLTADLMWQFGLSIDEVLDDIEENVEGEVTDDIIEEQTSRREIVEHLVFQLRAGLILALSFMDGNRWLPVRTLAHWLCLHARLIFFELGGAALRQIWLTESPITISFDKLPRDLLIKVELTLVQIFERLMVPCGAVVLDASRRHFLVNAQTMLIFEPGDAGFETLFAELEPVWQEAPVSWSPAPTELPHRRGALAPFQWLDAQTVEVPVDAHTFDLLALSRWAWAEFAGTAVRFRLDRARLAEAAAATSPEELQRLLTWLSIRSAGRMPDQARAMFPVASSYPEFSRDFLRMAGRGEVAALFDAIDVWNGFPPYQLVEELRAWGPAATEFLHAWVREILDSSATADSTNAMRLAVIVLHDLAHTPVVPELVRIAREVDDDLLVATSTMALGGFGKEGYRALKSLLEDGYIDVDLGLMACGGAAALAIQSPALTRQAINLILAFAHADEWENDVVTHLAIYLAETGHFEAAKFAQELRSQGRWDADFVSEEDFQWIFESAPSVWGHPSLNGPLSHLFPSLGEAEDMLRNSGFDDLMHETSFQPSPIMAFLPFRKKFEDDR